MRDTKTPDIASLIRAVLARGSNVKWHTDVQSECAKWMLALGWLGQERLARSRKRVVAP